MRYFLFLISLILSVFVGFIVTMPLSVEVQLLLGIATLASMFLIQKVAGTFFRVLFLSLGGLMVGRYVYWRVMHTIPPVEDLANFIPGAVLVAAELFCILMFLLSALIVADPFKRPRRLFVAKQGVPAPSVDVFIPTYNESPELVAVTVAAAVGLNYPKDRLKVYLLDDGGTDQKVNSFDPAVAMEAERRRRELGEICDRLGATYLARPRNEQAKAGNLNYGLSQSTGELVVVFDADHAPSREFLQETIAYFDDPKLFLVQTPHFFLNPDPIERNLQTFGVMPSENDMFYSLIQRGLDKWDAAFFCGSAAVLRRAALNEVGGFSGVSITEDCETALELHARGWSSAYVDRPMIAGLQPDTLASFIGQRSRWCRGMLQILLLKTPFLKPGLNMMQRVAYMTTGLFWMFPFPRIAFLLSPLLFILFGMQIYLASAQEFIAYTGTYILAVIMIQSGLYGRVRWPWISELYEYIQSVYLLPAIISVLINPRAPSFNVTEKGETLEKDEFSVIALPYILVFSVLLAVCGVWLWRFQSEPSNQALLVVVGVWHLFNVIIAGAAMGAVFERKEVRKAPRVRTMRKGFFKIGGDSMPVAIEEANSNGVLIKLLGSNFGSQSLIGQSGEIVIQPMKGVNGSEASSSQVPLSLRVNVASQRISKQKCFLGLGFEDASHVKAMAASDLVHANLDIPRAVHAGKFTGSSVLGSSLRIAKWALVQSMLFGPRVAGKLFSKLGRKPKKEKGQYAPDYVFTPAE